MVSFAMAADKDVAGFQIDMTVDHGSNFGWQREEWKLMIIWEPSRVVHVKAVIGLISSRYVSLIRDGRMDSIEVAHSDRFSSSLGLIRHN